MNERTSAGAYSLYGEKAIYWHTAVEKLPSIQSLEFISESERRILGYMKLCHRERSSNS